MILGVRLSSSSNHFLIRKSASDTFQYTLPSVALAAHFTTCEGLAESTHQNISANHSILQYVSASHSHFFFCAFMSAFTTSSSVAFIAQNLLFASANSQGIWLNESSRFFLSTVHASFNPFLYRSHIAESHQLLICAFIIWFISSPLHQSTFLIFLNASDCAFSSSICALFFTIPDFSILATNSSILSATLVISISTLVHTLGAISSFHIFCIVSACACALVAVSVGLYHACSISLFAISEFSRNFLKSTDLFSCHVLGLCALNSLSCGLLVHTTLEATFSTHHSNNSDVACHNHFHCVSHSTSHFHSL